MSRSLSFLFFFLSLSPLWAQHTPEIRTVTATDTLVEQYGKFEAALDLTATYTNPYNYEEILVSATFTAPDGQQHTVDGFYMQDFELNPQNGGLTPIGNQGTFKVRFSPNQTGEWTYEVAVRDAMGTATFVPQRFVCITSTNSENNGFVRHESRTNYLNFDNGKQYIPVGEDMAWQNNNPFLDYTTWLTELDNNNGNFFRLWHAHWGLGIEWTSGSNGFAGLRRYHERNSRYQDWLFDFCAERGIYVMLCLQHHGQVSSQVNPNWSESPYNAVNGGPAQNTWEFFTNAEAIAHTKNRFRYVVARWGYSRSIMSWELFNEVEWTDNFLAHRVEIGEWHAEMAAYLKEIDPYHHLVTTSYANDSYDSVVWANPAIDFTQTHFYINTSNIERALVTGIRNYLEDFAKPTLTGEFGLGGTSSLANADPNGVHVHNSLWATLFGGGMGSAMSWWWDSYIHPRDLYYHFAPVAKLADEIPFLEANLMPASSFVADAPGDLIVTPTLGWSSIGTPAITVDERGQLSPANAGLGTFLYGAQWNTQFRSPPSFSVVYPQAGTFSVKTSAETGTAPKIAIYVDNELVLEQVAGVRQTFTVVIPAGAHTIKVDNTGTDWITIASYTFSGLGSKIDSYVLVSENRATAAGWVLNNQYNHEFLAANGEPEAATGGKLLVEGFATGSYTVVWYDCLDGTVVRSETAFAENETLQLPIPTLYWDLAFQVNGGSVGTKEVKEQLAFDLYPNPAKPGDTLTLSTSVKSAATLTLLDVAGKIIHQYSISNPQHATFSLPTEVPAGLYWLKLESDRKSGSKPIVVRK